MKKLLLIPLFFCLSFTAQSQDFGSAIGARLGYPLSASYKFFVSESSAIEAIVGYRWFLGYSYLTLGGAYQIHKDIDSVEGLQWYFGGGASAQLYSGSLIESSVGIGVQGYIGLSYTFDELPINLSVDWVPSINIGGYSGISRFGGSNGALAIRYILGRKDNS